MSSKAIWAAIVVLAAATCGCDGKWPDFSFSSKTKSSGSGKPETTTAPVAPDIAGTVSQYATLVSYQEVPATGYGVVVGLGKNGSIEIPVQLEKYMTDFLYRRGLGSAFAGTDAVSPARFLKDPDTAIVLVSGIVPPCAPAGTRFDIQVSSIENTSTKSLDGGTLMPADMYILKGGATVPGGPGTSPLAEGKGEVMLNPFLEAKDRIGSKVLQGRVPGGGVVIKDLPVRLLLAKPDYPICRAIQKRINDRFGQGETIANAANSYSVDIKIPPYYRKNYQHFLNLVMRTPVHFSNVNSAEMHALKLTEAMEFPGAKFDELSLAMEAIGPGAIPVLQSKYSSSNPYVSFYCARAGLRLDDVPTAYPIIVNFAQIVGSPLRVDAINELGKTRQYGNGVAVLKELLDDSDDAIRIAACESLINLGGGGSIGLTKIDDKFRVYEVNSTKNYMIWVSQTKTPKIFLFGKDMPIARNIFYNAPGDAMTLNSNPSDPKLGVWRKIPRNGAISEELKCEFEVLPLIGKLGLRPEFDDKDEIKGLNFTYGQTVSFLYDLTKTGGIKANFVLQPAVDLQTIYKTSSSTGRPD